MSLTMVKDFAVLQQILTDLENLGITLSDTSQITPEIYNTWCNAHGYAEIVNDAGEVIGRVAGRNIVEVATNASAESTALAPTVISSTSTAAEVETLVGEVVETAAYTDTTVGELALTSTAAATTTGDTAAALVLTPKTALITGVLAALGFTAGFDIGRDIVDKMLLDDSTFDWSHDSIGGKIITYLTKDGKTYVDQDLIERLRQWLDDNGYLDGSATYTYPTGQQPNTFQDYSVIPVTTLLYWLAAAYVGTRVELAIEGCLQYVSPLYSGFSCVKIGSRAYGNYTNYDFHIYSFDTHRGRNGVINESTVGTHTIPTVSSSNPIILDNNYSRDEQVINIRVYDDNSVEFLTQSRSTFSTNEFYNYSSSPTPLVTLINIGTMTSGGILPVKPGATTPTSGTPLSDTYPNWYNNRKYRDNQGDKPQDKTKPRTPMLPIQTPYTDPEDRTQPDAQGGTNPSPDDDYITGSSDGLPPDTVIPPVPDDTGETDTPVSGTSGTGTGFVHIYNPTLAQLATFSQWLWSSNVFANMQKLFQDPMEALIGLNLLYATPSVSPTVEDIILGNLNSLCPSRIVTEQYINIDCGTITIGRYYNNALDYLNTDVSIYLPFVGIVRVNPAELIGKAVNIKCTVDVLTGTVLYRIIVAGQTLYTYPGNCAVQLPISSSNYSSVLASGIALIGSVGAAVASGGTLTPVAVAGAANMAGNLQHGVERSGNIGSNAGAMGNKKPYLIITRNRPYNPSGFNEMYGYPSNQTVKLGNCRGYTRVKDVKMENILATESELRELETLLKEGVYL